VAFGLKVGLDAGQIRAALDRMKVLWTAAPVPNLQPRPITRDDFHKLLKAAGDGPWHPRLLAGLNLCLHLGETCGLKWSYFGLDVGTFACIHEKTRRQRIPRAAVLWSETIAASKALPRKGPYVFTSSHGGRHNTHSAVNEFRTFRTAAGVPACNYDTLRDGAYTTLDVPAFSFSRFLGTELNGMSGNTIVGIYISTEGFGDDFLYNDTTFAPLVDPNAGANHTGALRS